MLRCMLHNSSAGYHQVMVGSSCGVGTDAGIVLHCCTCPACDRAIIQIEESGNLRLVVPRVWARKPIHTDVPVKVRKDYAQAVVILSDSPEGSAALSRRCLQAVLVLNGAKKDKLDQQLDELIPTLPAYIAPYLHHVRKLGNIAAHASQSKSTGEIVDVEPGEAEWLLELIEELFDHYYAKPAEAKARQAALTAKFADAGKLKP